MSAGIDHQREAARLAAGWCPHYRVYHGNFVCGAGYGVLIPGEAASWPSAALNNWAAHKAAAGLADAIEQARREARAQERQRCAEIAWRYSERATEGSVAAIVAADIAKRIGAGAAPPSPAPEAAPPSGDAYEYRWFPLDYTPLGKGWEPSPVRHPDPAEPEHATGHVLWRQPITKTQETAPLSADPRLDAMAAAYARLKFPLATDLTAHMDEAREAARVWLALHDEAARWPLRIGVTGERGENG
jgi:hypothetical protein